MRRVGKRSTKAGNLHLPVQNTELHLTPSYLPSLRLLRHSVKGLACKIWRHLAVDIAACMTLIPPPFPTVLENLRRLLRSKVDFYPDCIHKYPQSRGLFVVDLCRDETGLWRLKLALRIQMDISLVHGGGPAPILVQRFYPDWHESV